MRINLALRPYDLGSTQWYVLHQLVNEGPTMQRDLVRMLRIESATLSGIVTTLVRKGLVDQTPDSEDQRQRMLRITRSGKKLLKRVARSNRSHPGSRIRWRRSRGVGDSSSCVQAATQRLNEHISGGN
jgi:DNA-binding MarR family transcriptional regulator